MLTLVANGLVLIGAGILVAGLGSVWRLITRLPRGPLHQRWYVLGPQALTTGVDPGEIAGKAVAQAGGSER